MGRYCQVAEEEGSEAIELPIEEDGTMLLTTLTSQFPGASGLKYRNEQTGTIRAVSLSETRFQQPETGWDQSGVFYCVFPKENKRKSDDISDEDSVSKAKRQRCTDLIVLGLPWKTNEDELKEYFEQFGEVLMAQVKKDQESGLSKGFGFIRFSDYDIQKKVIAKRHNIGGRWCDVRIPLSKAEAYNSEFNRKIFVGRLTEDITSDDLRDYFSKFGEITDIFIPRPFRAFAFVTYESELNQSLCGEDHIVKGVSLHVSNAMPKNEININRFSDPMNSHFGYGSSNHIKPTHGGLPSMSHQSRYSHTPYYSSYAARRSYGAQPIPRRID